MIGQANEDNMSIKQINKEFIPTEDQEQAALFRWASMMVKTYPALDNLFAIPNGGYRNKVTACMLKVTGTKPGVPDIFLAYPRNGYSGLFIEMKRTKGGSVSSHQKEWMGKLMDVGYCCVVCRGFDEARQMIIEYLK